MSTQNTFNARAQKGFVLAELGRVKKIIPKTTAAQLYKVDNGKGTLYSVIEYSSGEVTCDCQDFKNRGLRETCKHIYAVVYAESQFGFQTEKRERIDISGADFD